MNNHAVGIRVGDFYEFYNEDAKSIAKTLELTLTSRTLPELGTVPMAGFPFHSAFRYLEAGRANGLAITCVEGEVNRLCRDGIITSEAFSAIERFISEWGDLA